MYLHLKMIVNAVLIKITLNYQTDLCVSDLFKQFMPKYKLLTIIHSFTFIFLVHGLDLELLHLIYAKL